MNGVEKEKLQACGVRMSDSRAAEHVSSWLIQDSLLPEKSIWGHTVKHLLIQSSGQEWPGRNNATCQTRLK